MLVPSEQVLVLAVDLPLATRARRLEALPFAVEDRIADPIDAVHLALGAEIAPKRYLVGVVRRELMADWCDRADAAGLGHAAMVPDALALPQPDEGRWSVDLGAARAVVRAGDGTGFACAAPLLGPAWEAAGRPRCTAYGAPLPAAMGEASDTLDPGPLAMRLAVPALDLRQGAFARRAGPAGSLWRRLGWVIAIGAAAHVAIAAADTLALRGIADRRAGETEALLTSMGAPAGTDPAQAVAATIPRAGAPQVFVPLLARVSEALTPLAGSFHVRAIGYEGKVLTIDLDSTDPALAGRIRAALAGARVKASVAAAPDGGVRLSASAS